MAAFKPPTIASAKNQGQRLLPDGSRASTPSAPVKSANLPQKPASGGKPVSENMNTATAAAVLGKLRASPASSSTVLTWPRGPLKYVSAANTPAVAAEYTST